MCPPATVPSDYISPSCTDDELCIHLERIMNGSPLPGNVITDNPYQYMPSNFPDGIWFLTNSRENKDSHLGYWRPKEEACRILSNTFNSWWKRILEFYETQGSNEKKTDWVMQEYWITPLSEENKTKEARLLCRVVFNGKQNQINISHLNMTSIGKDCNYIQSIVKNTEEYNGQVSTSKPQVSTDIETGQLAVREGVSDNLVDNMSETDCLSRGDYLELLDLDTPASPSSSSASSCMTMSSDEYFDSLALLQDLESEDNQERVQREKHYKFSVSASLTATEQVMPTSLGILHKSPSEELLRTDKSITRSVACSKMKGENILKNQKRNGNEGSSSSSQNVEAEEKKAVVSKKLLKKYLCFMSF